MVKYLSPTGRRRFSGVPSSAANNAGLAGHGPACIPDGVPPLPPLPIDYGRRMPRVPEARNLVRIGKDASGHDIRLAPGAARAWLRMRDAAQADGVALVLVSGFRSVARQRAIVQRKARRGDTWERILRVSAYPGHSEHHSGRAVDLAAPGRTALTAKFGRSRQYRWLLSRAAQFGFVLSYPVGNPHGIAFEPWHWCYRGRPGVPRRPWTSADAARRPLRSGTDPSRRRN